MRLEKWYLDAVFPDGTVWFGYQARLRLRRCPPISWACGCEVLPDGRERKTARWRLWDEPRLEGGQWHWTAPDGFQARWTPRGPGMESPLGSDRQFRARWTCLAPNAVVTRTRDGAKARGGGPDPGDRGVGYVEHLQLDAAAVGPPFRRLWWGRAHAEESSLVWIRWDGGRDLTLIWENGAPVAGDFESLAGGGARIRTARGQWETGRGRTLCDRDARRSFPRWLVRLAGGMAPTRECKMAGPALWRAGAEESVGTGVWEEVEWA